MSDKTIHRIIEETTASLENLRAVLAGREIALTVPVLPWLKPYGEWDAAEKNAYRQIITILGNLNIRYFDLLEPMQTAVTRGVTIRESPADTWHPSRDLARIFARNLKTANLLVPAKAGGD